VSKERLIAVIDDDEAFRLALVDALSSLGYGARGFASAEEFIAGDGTKAYDGVITDVHLPGMSGFHLAQLLAYQSRTPVIMITAHAEPGLEARAASIGAVCLLLKPFEVDALTHCLERALRV
jgi:FixJ family two-component response regulator